jgi:hypothetical protein
MAKPRIFISSTYYDLKSIRSDLERFIRGRGFEPVMSERGHIPFQSDKALEEACYKEIEICDILVSIIGGRYGNESRTVPYSISQSELKTALNLGKPVYIFVEKNVFYEYRTYEQNKDVKKIKYTAVDDTRIYKFLEEVMSLPSNNPVKDFENSGDIIEYLQEQWAGLFQRLLEETARQKQGRILEDMKATANTLNQLVTFLTEERKKGDQAIHDILLANHPLFIHLQKMLLVPYRVYFQNLDEMKIWLPQRSCDNFSDEADDYYAWIWKRRENELKELKISKHLFEENGRLKVITPEEWKTDYVELNDLADYTPPAKEEEDIPF